VSKLTKNIWSYILVSNFSFNKILQFVKFLPKNSKKIYHSTNKESLKKIYLYEKFFSLINLIKLLKIKNTFKKLYFGSVLLVSHVQILLENL